MQNELRKSDDLEDWEIISTLMPEERKCLLCPKTYLPNTEEKIEETDAITDKKGFWIVRSIVDPYPITHPSAFKLTETMSLKKKFNAHGWTELIVETRDHNKEFHEFTAEEIANVLKLYQKRITTLKKRENVASIIIIKDNLHRDFEHAFSRIITLPIVPKTLREKVDNFNNYKIRKEKCLYCDIIKETNCRITENENFVSLVPFSSAYPYHVQIFPKKHLAEFEKLSEVELFSLSEIIRDTLIRMKAVTNPFKYFIAFMLKPTKEDDFHFHVEIGQKTIKEGIEHFGIHFSRYKPEDYAKILRG